MLKTAKKVIAKLEEYDFEITDHHELDSELVKQYIIYTPSMVIQTNEDEQSIGISFHANLRPELAAQNLLILQETGIKKIDIMEPYYYNKDGKFTIGDEARKQNMKDITQAIVDEQAKILRLMTIPTYNA
jgi:hypothetical protein